MKTENVKNETEILNAEDDKLRVLCSSLKSVEAPKDFDFKLKARIANSKTSDFEPRFGFVFRYVLPAFFVILLFGLFAYNSGLFSSTEKSPLVASGEVPSTNPALPQNVAVQNFSPTENKSSPKEDSPALPADQNLPKVSESMVAQSDPKNSTPVKKSELKKEVEFKGNIESTSRAANVILPNGFNQKPVFQNSPNDDKSNALSVKGVLAAIGINVEVENNKWSVKSVTANSVAERSGIRQNDSIEAIDEKPLDSETAFGKTISVRAVTVSRGGERIVFKLRNK